MNISYKLVLSRVCGAIHHGGSGTTHMILKCGCPTLMIPHIVDQFIWNSLVEKIGAGPLGISIHKITKENLEPKILNLFTNPSYKEKAGAIKEVMAKEHFEEKIVSFIESKVLSFN